MRKRLWDLAKSRIEIGTILPGHRHKVLGSFESRLELGLLDPRVGSVNALLMNRERGRDVSLF